MKTNMRDNWDARLYDENHFFVSEFGKNLIGLLAPKKGENILDAGCGTGDLTNAIHGYGAVVIGMDKSPNMIQAALKKYPHLSFQVGDILELPWRDAFDAVFSNAVLHWIKDAKRALHNFYQSLKPGGRFVAEFGGKGNIQIITKEIISQLKARGIPFSQEQFPW